MKPLPPQINVNEHVIVEELDEESVLLNLETGKYFELDDVGTRMWQLLATHDNIDHVISSLLAEYDVNEKVLRNDLASLIGRLADAGLVKTEAV